MTASSIQRSRWLALVLLILGMAIIVVGPGPQPNDPTTALPDEADSTWVAQQLPPDQTDVAIILYSTDNGSALNLEALPSQQVRPSPDGSAALEVRTIDADTSAANAEAIKNLRAEVNQSLQPGVSASVTGPAAISADLASVFDGASSLLLGVTAAVVAALLVITYKSPILWILPLLVVGLADRAANSVATWSLNALGMRWDESTIGILSVLVFGAGTNYALLLISRYRDELTHHEDRFVAMARAWAPTVRACALSAITVAIGVGCLLLSSTPNTRSLGLASAIGVIVAVVFAAFCLPGVLVAFDRWIFWPRRPVVGQVTEHRLWDRIGATVSRVPLAVAVTAFAGLIALSIGSLQIETGLDQSEQFINTPESISAARELSEKFPEQSATPATVVSSDLDRTAAILNEAGFNPVPTGNALSVSGAQVEDVRTALKGTDARVGGQKAQLLDAETYASKDRSLIFPLVIALIFVSLVLVLKSLVAPLIMVLSVVLTNVAALGLGWWISTGILGFESFDSTVPLYAFVFLVALGVDYTIFLVTRTRDDAAESGTRQGILTALSATGGVITSAGILLAAVFAVLGVLPLVALAQIGIVICVGVLLDALVVRTLLVPAVVQLLGERFWAPGRVRREALTADD